MCLGPTVNIQLELNSLTLFQNEVSWNNNLK